MKSLKSLLSFKTPSYQYLIDVALITALLPHIFTAKFSMIVYMLAVLVVLWRIKEVSKPFMAFCALVGLFAIIISFLGSFNFVGLSEFSVYIQLVSSLLIYAVSLQRLSRQINFYLLISPMLLLALSYFIYNTIFMLIYSISALYIFLLLLLWARMHSPLIEAIRSTSILFITSLPLVALLFMVFPRISFDKKDYGFRDTASLRTGHDGLMHIGSDALLVPSKKVVMEVWFDSGIPSPDALYFRGSVLYIDKGKTWVPFEGKRKLSVLSERESTKSTSYRVTLYPHKKRWLYMLDYPFSIGRKSNFSRDLIATWDNPITDVFRYKASSMLASSTPTVVEEHILKAALVVHKDRDIKTQTAMRKIEESYLSKRERYRALNSWFMSKELNYTLKPDKLDLEHPIDSLIYDSKKGYCVHFASSYATMARMLSIPSRVVTGFKGDISKSIENYLVVREEDAHAWVEVYLEDEGWLRVDPTRFSSGIALDDEQTSQALGQKEQNSWKKLSKKINLYAMYTKYVIQKWILYYDRSKQMQLLRELMNDTILVLKFVGVFLLLITISIFTFITLRRQSCSDDILCAMRPLLKALKRKGIEKKHGEDMHSFLLYANAKTDTDLLEIDRLYHELRYGNNIDSGKLEELKKLKAIVLNKK